MACIHETCDPETYVDTQGFPEWENYMNAEIDSLKKNQTWELIPQLQGMNVVNCQWVYKTNFISESVVECHKAHLVSKGFS